MNIDEKKLWDLIKYPDKDMDKYIDPNKAVEAIRFIALKTVSNSHRQAKCLRQVLVAAAKVEAAFVRDE